MKFGPVPVAAAEGAICAHTVHHPQGVIRKGRTLTRDDIEALAQGGIDEVVVAWLEPGDVHEDQAAAELAAMLASDSVRADAAYTGRVNLFAQSAGVLRVDARAVARLNRIHESLTLATLAPYSKVSEGRMVATVKVIPYAAPRAALDEAVAVAGALAPVFSVAPFRAHDAGLVLTEVPGTRAKVLDKTVRVMAERLEALGSTLGGEIRCAHDADAIADAIAALNARGHDPIIVFGASAIVDREDMVPAGLVKAGGAVAQFGMPVDPGNLMMLGSLGPVTVIGAPGCARSPKENGFDWVLQRLLAGIEVGREDVTEMGAGGLLMEIESRPHPRARKPEAPRRRRIAALVLAAGQSRRMGGPNKLLEQLGQKPLVRHAVEAALASKAGPVIVVTGHMEDQVRAALDGLDVSFAHNGDFAEGLSTSLRAGLGQLDKDAEGALVLLGDMPGVSAALIDRMIDAFAPDEGRAIIVPTCSGKRGNPVLFAAAFLDELRAVRGDIGARHLIGLHEEAVHEVVADETVLLDVDTPQAMARARGRFKADRADRADQG